MHVMHSNLRMQAKRQWLIRYDHFSRISQGLGAVMWQYVAVQPSHMQPSSPLLGMARLQNPWPSQGECSSAHAVGRRGRTQGVSHVPVNRYYLSCIIFVSRPELPRIWPHPAGCQPPPPSCIP